MDKPTDSDAYTEVFDWVSGVASEAHGSNRALVLVGAARLDMELEQALKVTLVSNPTGQDNLFDTDRPLGTFSAKINLAHRLGITDHDFQSALHTIRKIRNDFAHSVERRYLSKAPHKERVAQLVRLANPHPLWDMGLSMIHSPWLSDQSQFYAAAVIVMTISLVAFKHRERPFQVHRACQFRSPSD